MDPVPTSILILTHKWPTRCTFWAMQVLSHRGEFWTGLGLDWIRTRTIFVWFKLDPVSSEMSDLCETYDLLLFVSHFACQSKGTKFGDYSFDVCCVN